MPNNSSPGRAKPETNDGTSRRRFLHTGLLGVGGGLLAGLDAGARERAPVRRTPSEIEGPFYPLSAQKDTDFDLTRVAGRDDIAAGRAVWLEGEVVDTDGSPLEDATVDLWQANAAGRYRHPHDRTDAPLDPAFQGWAIVPSGKDGGFRFKTVVPGTYPVSTTWTRPPHIHFKVSRRGYVELVTQMYFPGHPLNDVDRLLLGKAPEERDAMIARKAGDEPETYRYRIVLALA